MNISELTSAKLRSLASIKEQIENLEEQAARVINGIPAFSEPAAEILPAPERKSAWTPARKRKLRQARIRQIARWKRQGLNGRGQPI